VAYFEKQQFAKAIATFEDALKYDPANQDMRTNLGMVYFQQGQFSKVVETLTEVSITRPTDQRVLTALAVAHFAEGRYGEASSFYERLAPLVPNDPVLRIMLAVASQLAGRPDAARLPQLHKMRDASAISHHSPMPSQPAAPAAIEEYEKALLVPTLPEVNYLWASCAICSDALVLPTRAAHQPTSADAAYSGAY
jgi:tetratricopeptide (TPR) repeat protein